MPTTYDVSRFAFLRLLGVCLVAAFWALVDQSPGLIGARGISPLAATMTDFANLHGAGAFWRVPTWFWVSTGDWFVAGVAWTGLVASVLLALGIAPRLASALCFSAFLSFRALEAGPLQWFNWPFDDALCEATFVAIFWSPSGWRPTLRGDAAPAAWPRWLLTWLLIRLVLGPGLAKLALAGSWFDGDAVRYFLVTQPFPTPAAATVHALPDAVLRMLTYGTLAFELVAPVLFLIPGRPRRWAAASGIALMLGIQACGNFRGLNLLTIGLLLVQIDDATLQRLLPAAWVSRRRDGATAATSVPRSGRLAARARMAGGLVVPALVVAASLPPVASQLQWRWFEQSRVGRGIAVTLGPFHLAANYSMFCAVPQHRTAVVIQGTMDGELWRDYQPIGLPTDVSAAPRWFAPYQDYLGFRLWLSSYAPPAAAGSWLPALLDRLAAGEPAVLRLFRSHPFPGQRPRQVRACLFRYRFADAEGRRADGFWQRELQQVHFGPIASGSATAAEEGQWR